MGDLDKNLWEAIQAFREMYIGHTGEFWNAKDEEKAWQDLLNLPPKDSVYDHELLIGEERNHFGTYLILIDCTAKEVKRWKIRGKVE